MESQLSTILTGLGGPERSFIEDEYSTTLAKWAKLIDEIDISIISIDGVSNYKANFDQCKSQFQTILTYLGEIDIKNNPGRLTDLKNHFQEFKQSYFGTLLDIKKTIQAASSDESDVNALRKVLIDARKERLNFEKSFKENLQKQSSNSQRTLAAHFEQRLKDLKNNDNTNPEKWIEKRNKWGWILVFVIGVFLIAYVILISSKLIAGYELVVAVSKLAIIALLYTQYHFATKNYHIYADLVAKYEHLAVISKTMTDFIAADFNDQSLREAVLSNASKTLFGELNTGHAKIDQKDVSVFENIINQLPKVN